MVCHLSPNYSVTTDVGPTLFYHSRYRYVHSNTFIHSSSIQGLGREGGGGAEGRNPSNTVITYGVASRKKLVENRSCPRHQLCKRSWAFVFYSRFQPYTSTASLSHTSHCTGHTGFSRWSHWIHWSLVTLDSLVACPAGSSSHSLHSRRSLPPTLLCCGHQHVTGHRPA